MGYIGAGPTRFNTADELTVTGDAEFNGNATFGDSNKAIFGAGSGDFEIYSDGTFARIMETGGNFLVLDTNGSRVRISSDNSSLMADFVKDGAVELYYANSEKLATTSGGIDVTGTVTADGLTVDGSGLLQASGTGNIELTLKNNNVSPGSGRILFADTTASDAGVIQYEHGGGADAMVFKTATNEAMRIDSSGNVGIGTTSPNVELEISGSGEMLRLQSTDTNKCSIKGRGSAADRWLLGTVASNDSVTLQATSATGELLFKTGGTNERMRISSSGTVMVGRTTTGYANTGAQFTQSGAQNIFVADGDYALGLGRNTSDGTIQEFRKDGTAVGGIGTEGGDLTIGTGDTGLQFYDFSDAIRPWNFSSNVGRDNAIDLGTSGDRYDDIYATNGTIQTSDANEKQDIEELSEAEQRVAVAAKGLLRKYRWIDSVAEKGDDARIHFGIIAQDLKAAFEAEGLDAGRYAMFINSEWTDEETGEPRSRMGVRYNQLLAFIIAAI